METKWCQFLSFFLSFFLAACLPAACLPVSFFGGDTANLRDPNQTALKFPLSHLQTQTLLLLTRVLLLKMMTMMRHIPCSPQIASTVFLLYCRHRGGDEQPVQNQLSYYYYYSLVVAPLLMVTSDSRIDREEQVQGSGCGVVGVEGYRNY